VHRVGFTMLISSPSSSSRHGAGPLLGLFHLHSSTSLFIGHAVTLTVKFQFLTVKTHVQAEGGPCVMYGGQSGTWTGFSPGTEAVISSVLSMHLRRGQ
jgi:hypothetical protein